MTGGTFLQELAARAARQASKKAGDPAWIDRILADGRREAEKLGPELRGPAEAALNVLGSRRKELASVAPATFMTVSSQLALGRVDEARRAWLAEQASIEDRLAALDGAMVRAEQSAREREENWERVKQVALDVVIALGKTGLKLLIAAV